MKCSKMIATAMVVVLGTMAAVAELGPVYHKGTIAGNSTDTYTCLFEAGEMPSLVVNGDRSSDLDLFVYDDLGNLICSDTDVSDCCVVNWLTLRTCKFTIKVVNKGFLYNTYELYTR